MSKEIFFQKEFIQKIMKEYTPDNTIEVLSAVPFELDNSSSILVTLASAQCENNIGHFGLDVTYKLNNSICSRKMVMKIKPHGDEIVNMLSALAHAAGDNLGAVYDQYKARTGFQFTHHRENQVYNKLKPDFAPEIFGLYSNDAERVYIILLEYLEEVELINSVMDPEEWTDKHIKSALDIMAGWHAKMLDQSPDLKERLDWKDSPSAEYMTEMTPLWNALLQNAHEKFPDLYTAERASSLQLAIDAIPADWAILDNSPKTIIHNDLNPRNSYFTRDEGGISFRAYDWELVTVHTPAYDVAEFLCFVLDKERYQKRQDYVEYYRSQLNSLSGKFDDPVIFKKLFLAASRHFGMHRLGMYMMAHTVSPYPFLPRVVNSFFNSVEEMAN